MPAPSRHRQQAALAAIARHPWRTALAAVAIALVVLALVWDWNWFKGPLERAVEARTGRSFDIGGDLDVDVGSTVTISAGALRLGNAEWSAEPEMARADRALIRLHLPSLLRRQTRIPAIELVNPRLRLELGAQGGNWNLFESSGDGTPARIERLWIEGGELLFLHPADDTRIEVSLESQESARAETAPPVAIAGSGQWRGNDFSLEGRIASLLDLQQQETQPGYGIDLEAEAGRTRAHARGVLFNPFQLQRFDLQMALSGANLADLYPLLGVALPDTPPYTLDGRLGRDANMWTYREFSGEVGDSDLAGEVAVTVGGDRPHFSADLVSEMLDFDDLAGLVGAAPDSGPDDTTNPELQARAEQRAAAGKVLPDTPYELDKLRAMDADVRLRASRIESPVLPLDEMDAHLVLEDGLLTLQPLTFGMAGGRIDSGIRMDARGETIQTRLDASVSGMELEQLFPTPEIARDALGSIGGEISLTGTGNSVARMLGSADGNVALGMGSGQISNLILELAGIDIFEALRFLITGDRLVPVRCAFADFAVQDGVMQARALAFDTTDTLIVGEGSIDLGEETLDLELRPRPKDRSLLSLRSPLVIDGTFADPGFRPDMGRLGIRGAIALALTSIAPPAALLATLELGPGEDAGCGGEYAE
ncbi:AsmA family protein [Luteimonas sp. A478]